MQTAHKYRCKNHIAPTRDNSFPNTSGGRGRPKQTQKKQVENEMKKNGLVKEDACDRTKSRGVVKTMTIRNLANSVDSTGSNM